MRHAVNYIRDGINIIPDDNMFTDLEKLKTKRMRDPDDIYFIALYYSSQANGIVTNNKRDYENHAKIIELAEIGKIATTYRCASTILYIETKSMVDLLYLTVRVLSQSIKQRAATPP